MNKLQQAIPWHSIEIDNVLAQLETTTSGLTSASAQQRFAQHGPNAIAEGRQRSLLATLLGQFSDFMIVVLLAAALISGFIGEPQDTIAILVIVLLNAIIGATQEFRAERAVAALREMAAPEAQAIRDSAVVTLTAPELVPGDVVLLEAGNVVPADVRLLQIEELEADESALTGESHPVAKTVSRLAQADIPVAERSNVVFKNSLLTRGRGKGVVIATGMDTEIGHIAALLRGEKRVKTPLQQRLTRFGRYLALAVLAICTAVFVAGLLQGQPAMLMFLTAVSLAVAAIPEALPAVVTIALAFGASRLIRQKALVRNLPAVETLGSVTYICADKTGTLTQNRMTVEWFIAAGEKLGSISAKHGEHPWTELGMALALNNDVVEKDGKPAGEPTELALFEAALQNGFNKNELEGQHPRLNAIPFDSERKQMTTFHSVNDGVLAIVKGAPEKVLRQCTRVLTADGEKDFTAEATLAEAEDLAGQGYRLLALAQRRFTRLSSTIEADVIECELTMLGLVALIDPPRPEAELSIADCLSAGITPVMITGDHPGTARAIAQRLGITDGDKAALTGQQLAELSDDEFARIVNEVRVYARVSPEQKLRIVKALQSNGEFVAMTGDGVNDAPALKRAGIGVSMGKKGTDVAREASDMVLMDDNFATIVSAVRAGRRIFDNIRKFIKDTMSSNSGEIWTLFLAPFFGLPIPLLPIHILWVNLVTDGLPGLAFTAEPAEPGIMKRPPRPPNESIFARGMWQHIVWVGLFVGGICIGSQAWAISRDVEYWQTIVFTILTISQLFHSLAVRSETASLFTIGLFSNLPMLSAVVLTMMLQLAVIYTPILNDIFYTQPLPLLDLLFCFAVSSTMLFAVEIEKWLIRHKLIYVTKEL